MSRHLEATHEEAVTKHIERTYRCLAGGLATGVNYSGGQLVGLSIKYSDYTVLMTLRAEFPGGRMVCFVGADDLPKAFIKATRKAGQDGLRWRKDRYATKD